MHRAPLPLALLMVAAGCIMPEEATTPTPPEPAAPATTPLPQPTPRDAQDDGAMVSGNETPAAMNDTTPNETNGTVANGTLSNETSMNESWPINGSFATYSIHTSAAPGQRAMRESWANATWTFFRGEWRLDCSGKYNSTTGRDDTKWRNGTFEREVDMGKDDDLSPRAEPSARRGGAVREGAMEVWYLRACQPRQLSLTKVAPTTTNVTLENTTTSLDADRGIDARSLGKRVREATWDAETRLLLSWTLQDRRETVQGTLVATDAPLGSVGP